MNDWGKLRPKPINVHWNSLPFRLIYVTVSTFLPLIFVVILVAAAIIGMSSDRVKESYQRELDVKLRVYETNIEEMEERKEAFVAEYMNQLTLAKGSDNMVSYKMLKDMDMIFAACNEEGIYYLYDKSADRMMIKHESEQYPVSMIEALRIMTPKEISGEVTNEWRLRKLQNRWFYAVCYEYTNYEIGFLMDVESGMLEGIREFSDAGESYLSDGEQVVCMTAAGEIYEPEQSWHELTENAPGMKNIRWNSEKMGLNVLFRIPGMKIFGNIPFFYWILLIISLLTVFLVFGLWKTLKKRVVSPIENLQDAMKQLEEKKLTYRIEDIEADETDEFRFLYESFNHMAEEIEKSYEKDIQMYKAQLDNLRLQVNPHMLLNSFNMIYSLAQTKDFVCIQEFSMYLVEYFRYVLKETDNFVTVEKEMNFVESYIGIQKIRFPGAFTSVYNMQPETKNALIPPLLIQNFVENAMKYALIPGKTIEVLINIRKEGDKLLISVCDTGRGMKEELMQCLQSGEVYVDKMGHKHIGVWNCRRRMEVFYGEDASMNITSADGEGTQVWLELPFLIS